MFQIFNMFSMESPDFGGATKALSFWQRGGLCDPAPGRNAFEFAVQKDRIRSSVLQKCMVFGMFWSEKGEVYNIHDVFHVSKRQPAGFSCWFRMNLVGFYVGLLD